MRCRDLLLSTAVALAASTGAATAGTTFHGWYVSIGAGANWIEDGAVHWDRCCNNTFSWENGFVMAAAVGYNFDSHWRVELEVAYRDNDADTWHNASGGSASGTTVARVWELSQMVNVLYDIDLGGRWQASIG